MKTKTVVGLFAAMLLMSAFHIPSAHADDLSVGADSDSVAVESGHPGPGHPNPGHPNPGHPGPGHPGPGHPGHPGGPGHIHDPYPGHHGNYPWHHWDHPYFPRPTYYWDWDHLRSVTCIAEDSEGDQYPVTEDGYVGYEYQQWLTQIEDAALDRCYDETNGDSGCFLLECDANY